MKLSSRMSLLALVPALALSACTEESYSLEKAVRLQTTSHLKYGDHDPVKIKGKQPKDFAVHGIDISRYNPAVNWRTVKREGIDFAFVKATEGKDDVAPKFAKWWSESGRSGIPRSAYHFYYFCTTPEVQARFFINTVPRTRGTLPPVLDMEWNPFSPTCQRRPDGATVRDEMRRWMALVEAHYGQRPIIYTTPRFYRENGLSAFKGVDFWLRTTAKTPAEAFPGQPWRFWQYTATGTLPNTPGAIDINAFNGSREAWDLWVERRSIR